MTLAAYDEIAVADPPDRAAAARRLTLWLGDRKSVV